jgi:7,8-dihydroneopterin aldolase/epimerase/oxygenase
MGNHHSSSLPRPIEIRTFLALHPCAGARLQSPDRSGILAAVTKPHWTLAEAPAADRRSEGEPGPLYRVFVRDLVLPCRIGIYEREKTTPQRVRINADLLVETVIGEDGRYHALDYETLVESMRRLTGEGHINLVETLAERVMALCLDDWRVRAARVAVEKLDVFPEAASVGVVLKRRRRKPPGGA